MPSHCFDESVVAAVEAVVVDGGAVVLGPVADVVVATPVSVPDVVAALLSVPCASALPATIAPAPMPTRRVTMQINAHVRR
jgi:hypothetical protein